MEKQKKKGRDRDGNQKVYKNFRSPRFHSSGKGRLVARQTA